METIEGGFDYEALLQSKSGNQVAVDHSSTYQLDWKPIDIRWDMDILDDPSAYIGQSDTSGMITIGKKDKQVKLTLGGYGFYFYAPASLCLEWQLDPSIFNVDYICVTE